LRPDNSPSQAALGQDVPATAAGQIPHPSDAERRQLTVLFCDLADSTRLARQFDPEDFRTVVRAIGSGERRERLALGDTPNLAARLQGLAEPNTVVISDTTARLVKGYFVCQDLGVQTLKGIDTPVRVAQVVGESPTQSRLDVAAASGLTPLVGRETEVTLLLERWAQARDGLGQVVLLSGEAGIGKSRLVRVLTERVVAEGAPRLTLHRSPYYTNSAFYPIIEHLQVKEVAHIDILQIRNGRVHILDYKPGAVHERPIAQLMVYALALSRRTGLRLYDVSAPGLMIATIMNSVRCMSCISGGMSLRRGPTVAGEEYTTGMTA
jgi:hypothetical protein